MGEFDDLIEEFVAESKEHIADIEDDLIKIESDIATIDPEVINRVFRAAHSIKGSAKFLDLTNIGDLAHRMEDVLNLIRSGKLMPSSDVAGPLLKAADMLKTMLDDVTTSNDMDISEHLYALQKILDRKIATREKPKKQARGQESPNALAPFNIDPDIHDILKKKLQTYQVYVLTLDPEQTDMDHMTPELGNLGEVLAETTEADGKILVLFATIMEADMIPLALGISKDLFTQINSSMLKPSAPKTPPPKKQASPKQAKKEKPKMEPATRAKAPVEQEDAEEYSAVSYDEPDRPEMPVSFKRDAQTDKNEENSSFITFTLDKEIYAVPIQTIEEIIGQQEISLLPNVPGFIKGVINLRGDIVPIMDLRLKFGLEPKEYTPFTVFLIVRVDERLMGMVVDNVADVLMIEPSHVQKKPAFSSRISTDFIDGVYKDSQEEMVILVDVPSLIKPEEWEQVSSLS